MVNRVALLLAALATPSPAQSQDLDLGWGSCGGPNHQTFECTSSSGHHDLVTSFVSPVDLEVVEVTTRLKVYSVPGIALPPWWNFTGEVSPCRADAVLIPDLGTNAFSGCANPFLGAITTTSSAQWQRVDTADETTLRGTIVQHFAEPVRVSSGVWLIANVTRIRNLFTFSPPNGINCPGCLLEACIVTESVDLTQREGAPGPSTLAIRSSAEQPRYVSWQRTHLAGSPCQGVTGTSDATWGRLKAHYR